MAEYCVHIADTDPDAAFFQLMKNYLPTGLLGLGFAGVLATVMSAIDSVLIAGATSVLKDFYLKLVKPNAPEHETLNLMRFFTALYGLVGLGIALLLPDIIQLSLLGSFVVLTLVPSVVGGFFWSRGTSKGAVVSILSGLISLVLSYPFLTEIAFIPSVLVATFLYVIVSLISRKYKSDA